MVSRFVPVSLFVALTTGCGSSVSFPDEPGDADTETGSDAGDPGVTAQLGAACTTPGKLACAGHAQKLQLLCDGAKWVANGTCAGQQICDTRPGPTAGSCQDPLPGCIGRAPGDSFCDGAVRTKCGPDLLDATSATCASPELCKAGVGDKCAVCVTGQHDCDGAKLLVCASDHLSFVLQETCITPALCSYSEGVCHDPKCAVGEYACMGDTLVKCNDGRLAFDPVKVCSAGLCDAAAKTCRDCSLGATECLGSTPRACDSSGHWASLAPCSGATPVCNAGVCKMGVCSTGEHRCTGDALEKCNAGSTGFDPVKTCGAGLCDAAAKDCDECKTGEVGCVGDIPRACDSSHHWASSAACSGTTPSCSAGTCVAGRKCNSGPAKVLFYGPLELGESPYLPPGAVVTNADQTTWAAMTTADFAKYQMIVIGQGLPCTAASEYVPLYDTRVSWSAAVNGRILLTESDAAYHAKSVPGAATFVRAALQWVATGPGTGLYVASDCGARGLDFMKEFGSFSTTGPAFTSDAVHILDSAHPAMAGSSDASLSGWLASVHGQILTYPSTFRPLAADPVDLTKVLALGREVACTP